MVYYTKDVLEKRVKSDKKSNVVFYKGETVGKHYDYICPDFKNCTLWVYYYSSHSKNFKSFTIKSSTIYSTAVDMLCAIGINEDELYDMLVYMSEYARGGTYNLNTIKYKGKVRLSLDNVDFWKGKILDDLEGAPSRSILCNEFKVLDDGKVITYDVKDVVPHKLVNVYSDGVIKVKEC